MGIETMLNYYNWHSVVIVISRKFNIFQDFFLILYLIHLHLLLYILKIV